MSDDSDTEHESKAVYIFGKDVSQIPCFRNTFLNGAGTGAGLGLLHFLFTSKVRKSLLVCYGSFFVSSVSYWFYCTYRFSKTRFEMLKLQSLVQEKLLAEGTARDFSIGETERQPEPSDKTL